MAYTGLPASLLPTQQGSPGAGRPAKVGKYSLLPIDTPAGWEQNDPEAEVIKRANEKFMKKGELPPYLRPKRSKAMLDKKNKNISRGFKDPKGGRTI
jgi:hypothetical protein